jgi:peptidoglycan L-alanyl-D-glutamate endopeptidase CwlK
VSARIEDLEPVTREMCRRWLDAALAAGLDVRVTHTLRTMDEQARLYAQGRTLPGPVVTRAKPGQSPHNYGMAFDFCFAGKVPFPPESDPRWLKAGQLGEAIGLSWGGPNGKGDKFTFDRPHLERPDWRTARATQGG